MNNGKKWKKSALIFLSLILSSCISHLLVDSDLRIQLINRSSMHQIRHLEVYDPTEVEDPLPVVSQILKPGDKSRVESVELTGSLYMRAEVADSSCAADDCWSSFDLGIMKLGEGSQKLVFSGRSEEELKVEKD